MFLVWDPELSSFLFFLWNFLILYSIPSLLFHFSGLRGLGPFLLSMFIPAIGVWCAISLGQANLHYVVSQACGDYEILWDPPWSRDSLAVSDAPDGNLYLVRVQTRLGLGVIAEKLVPLPRREVKEGKGCLVFLQRNRSLVRASGPLGVSKVLIFLQLREGSGGLVLETLTFSAGMVLRPLFSLEDGTVSRLEGDSACAKIRETEYAVATLETEDLEVERLQAIATRMGWDPSDLREYVLPPVESWRTEREL